MDRKGFTLWLTGLPCSGKTTLAHALEADLRARHGGVEILDGDVVRTHLSKGLGFSREDRDTNILRIAFVAGLLTRHGVAVITAAISPYACTRSKARDLIGNFVEVFVDAPVTICQERDVKGMYKKALAGEIKGFTGVDDPYEAPANPEIIVRTHTATVEECKDAILDQLVRMGYLPEP